MFTLGVRDTSTSFVQHPPFPLYVCFEIVPDNPFRVVILFYPLSSAKLPIYISVTYYPCLFFSILFSHILTVLSIFGGDKNGRRQPLNFGRPLCPFCIRLCSSVSGTGPLSVWFSFGKVMDSYNETH